MNLIELHILQSFPVTCLNRDDLGAPKSAIFGGVERARVSSQCWKRAVRMLFHELDKQFSETSRTKFLVATFVRAIQRQDSSISDENAEELAKSILAISKGDKKLFGKLDEKKGIVDTLVYISEECATNIAKYVLDGLHDNPKFKPSFGDVSKILGGQVSDAADIALFGRMVAADQTNSVEGAALFSHALSTHAVRSELDFFSAVDDEKKGADDAGAGQIGDIEFNSACYYRYVGINLDSLEKSHFFEHTQLKTVLDNFIRAVILANPSARKNSMFGQSLPSYVLALRRRGQPLSLANAFEKAVAAKQGGFVAPSIAALKKEWTDIKAAFGLDAAVECEIEKGREGTDSLASVLEKLLAVPS